MNSFNNICELAQNRVKYEMGNTKINSCEIYQQATIMIMHAGIKSSQSISLLKERNKHLKKKKRISKKKDF